MKTMSKTQKMLCTLLCAMMLIGGLALVTSAEMQWSTFDETPGNPADDGAWMWPVPGNSLLTSPFGLRGGVMHNGIDIAAEAGQPVYASRTGTVYDVRQRTYGYGVYVLIRHAGDHSVNGLTFYSRYAHLAWDSVLVSVGDRVESNTRIGAIGSTGDATGPHLHFGIYYNRPSNVNAVNTNPVNYEDIDVCPHGVPDTSVLTTPINGQTGIRYDFTFEPPPPPTPSPPPVPSPHPFTDVDDGWYSTYVQSVFEKGIMLGTTPTTFAPDEQFSRAQVATTLFRHYHGRRADGRDPRATPFDDVSNTEWYAPYVTWAYENEIVRGVAGNHFAPDDNVTREQFAVMMHRFARFMDYDERAFEDAQWRQFADRGLISTWDGAWDALVWASYHRLITGRPNLTIDPIGNATRAEAAAILTRFVQTFGDAH